MNRVFGKKKNQPPPPSIGDASASVGGRVDGLDEKIAKLEAELRVHKEKIKSSKGAAKQYAQKRAMDVLKRKRMYESQRDQLAAQQFNIESTAFAIETAQDTVTTVAAMKGAQSALKMQMKKINIDQVDDLADDMADLMEDMNEINEAMGRNYATPDDIDEADLEAELEALGDELEDEAISGATPSYLQESSPTPAVPTHSPNAEHEADDKFDLPVVPMRS